MDLTFKIKYRCFICEDIYSLGYLVSHLKNYHDYECGIGEAKDMYIPVIEVRVSGGYKYYPYNNDSFSSYKFD